VGATGGKAVSKEVRTDLLVGAVCDVSPIGRPPVVRLHGLLDVGHGQAAEPVDLLHPLGVPPRQVVVDRDDVTAPAPPPRHRGGEGGSEGLALACGHLRYAPTGDRPGPHDLDLERPLADLPRGDLADHGEAPFQVPRRVPAQAEDLSQGLGLFTEPRIGHVREGLLEGDHPGRAPQEPAAADAKPVQGTQARVPDRIRSLRNRPGRPLHARRWVRRAQR